MTITVYCHSCVDPDTDDDLKTPMVTDGPLYFNPLSKTQSQKYACEICDTEVTVVVEP